MFTTLGRSVPIVVLLVACARTPEPRVEPSPSAGPSTVAAPTTAVPAFDPVGAFTFAADVEGTTRSGTLDIRRNEQGALVGTIYSDEGSLAIDGVTVEGRAMRISFVMPDGPEVLFVMEFQGDEYTGSWSAQGASGALRGARKKE